MFDVDPTDELHELLSGLPLFPAWTSRSRAGETPGRHSPVSPRASA
ncbi:hypothetical protein [Lentzea miocenica]